jgi:hypothetical protein
MPHHENGSELSFGSPPYKDHHMHMKHSLFGLAVSVIFLCGPAYSAESTNELRETCEAVARADTLPLCDGKVTNCGHTAIRHDCHVGYLHDGHLYHMHWGSC